jgi:hypothetical protein
VDEEVKAAVGYRGGGGSVVETPQLGQGEAREGQKEACLSLPLTLRMKLLQTALGPVYSRQVLRKPPHPPSRIYVQYMKNLLSSA